MSTLIRLRLARPGPHGIVVRMPDSALDRWLEYPPDRDADGPIPIRYRPPIPSPSEITNADRVYSWPSAYLSNTQLRKIVRMRSLTRANGNPRYSYPHIGRMFGIHYKAVSRWHGDGLAQIASALNARGEEVPAMALAA